MSGQPNDDRPSMYPARNGLAAAARLRGTDVMLAAAGRSAGVTIAITYELRVGTSICDSALRTNSSAMTQLRSGMKGIATRHRLEGRWVNTMVLTRPMRLAMRTATRYESAVSTPVQKKMLPAMAADTANFWYSQSATIDCTTKPPA